MKKLPRQDDLASNGQSEIDKLSSRVSGFSFRINTMASKKKPVLIGVAGGTASGKVGSENPPKMVAGSH